MCLAIIFAECVSGTKEGDAEAHDCNKVHITVKKHRCKNIMSLLERYKAENYFKSL